VAVAIGLIGGHAPPDYDASFALIWGRDIAHGMTPDYSLPFRPAGHPLTTFVGVIGAPLGRDGAAELLRWVALLGAGAFVAAVFRLGQVLFGTAVGALAAVVLFTRAPLWGFSLLSFTDAWAAAFVVWAAVLEARTPRRGAPVFVLLGLAGLLRPEAWLFAAAYWVWIAIGSPSRALKLVPLVALGPLAWIVWDLATAGSFLSSVGTANGIPVAISSSGHGTGRTPDALARFVGGFVRPPELVAAVVGAVMLLRAGWRKAALPAALLVLNVVAFTIVAERGGPIEQRYLLVAAAMVLLSAAYAIADGRPRVVGIILALACLAYVPVDVGRIVDLRNQVRTADSVYSELRDLLEAPSARCALRGRVQVKDVRLRPFVAYWGKIPPERVDFGPGGTGAVIALDPLAIELSSRSLPKATSGNSNADHPHWRLAGACARQ